MGCPSPILDFEILSMTFKETDDFIPTYFSSLISLYSYNPLIPHTSSLHHSMTSYFRSCSPCQDSLHTLRPYLFIKIQLRYHLLCEALPNAIHTSPSQSRCNKVSAPSVCTLTVSTTYHLSCCTLSVSSP